jgi:hypothetical protein
MSEKPLPSSLCGSQHRVYGYIVTLLGNRSRHKGLLSGSQYRVEITSLRKTGKKIPSATRGPAPTFDLAENVIPARYNRETQLTAIGDGQTNPARIDFDLTSKEP